MPQSQYLSTDPNAGRAVKNEATPDQTYLSMDANAGTPIKTGTGPKAAPPTRPMGGGASAGDFARFAPEGYKPNANTVIDALPTVGGVVGGLVGAPGGPVASIATATLGGAAGEAARQGVRNVQRAFTGEQPQMVDPRALVTQGAVQGGAQAVGSVVTASMAKAAPWLMSKAIRPSATLLKEYRTTAHNIAKTLLEDGINVSQSGLEKLQKLIFADNAEIQALVNATPKVISKDKVLGRVDEYAMDAMKSQVNPAKSLEKATKVADDFVQHPYYKGDTISTPAAQQLKVGTYQEIGDAFNKPQKARALKAVGRGLKEEVAAATPGVSEINAREAKRLAGGEAVAAAIQKDASADPLGLLFAASNPTLFLAGLINKQPAVKSMLARGLYNTAAKATGVPENVIRGAVFAVAGGQEDEK